MKKMTNELREKIKIYKKNGKDVSELIKGYSLKGEDLSRCIIKNLYGRIHDDCSGAKFSYATLGEEGQTTEVSGASFSNCNFRGTRFLGNWIARNCNFKNATFVGAYIPHIEYQNADLRGATLCNTVFLFGTNKAKGAKLDRKMFEALMEIYDLDFELEFKEKSKENNVWITKQN